MCSVATTPATRPLASLAVQTRVALARAEPPIRGKVAPIVDLMAERLAEHELARGACTADDLARDGFTSAEILEHGPDAVKLAAAREASRLRHREAA